MPGVGNSYLTLLDLSKQLKEGNKEIATVIEMLSQSNSMIKDAHIEECNSGTTHLTTVRSGLPSVTWRKLYGGVQPSKGTIAQVKDTTGMLEAWSEIDSKLVDLAPNPAQFRLNESMGFVEAMSQEMESGVIYHDTAVNPEKFMGLAPRFNSLSADNGNQIVSAAGVGSDNTSIWFVVWGPRTCHLIYPRGSKAGLQRVDKGIETKTNSNGSLYDVHREKFSWDIGLTVRDWRYISRVANIDVSNMQAGSVAIDDFMISAYYKLQQRRMANGKLVIYCHREVKEALHKLAKDKTNVNLSLREFEGEEVVSFLGAPIRESDAILLTETLVS